MLDQSSLISIGSAIAVIAYNYGMLRTMNQNIEKSFSEFKTNIEKEMEKEKVHVSELNQQRFGSIEKDVDEMFSRIRKAEESLGKIK